MLRISLKSLGRWILVEWWCEDGTDDRKWEGESWRVREWGGCRRLCWWLVVRWWLVDIEVGKIPLASDVDFDLRQVESIVLLPFYVNFIFDHWPYTGRVYIYFNRSFYNFVFDFDFNRVDSSVFLLLVIDLRCIYHRFMFIDLCKFFFDFILRRVKSSELLPFFVNFGFDHWS